MYTFIYEKCNKKTFNVNAGKLFQHVIPAAPLLTFLPSDSQVSCSLTWVEADFHSIVPGLPFSAILVPVQNRKSCLQLFPALWTKEFLQARTHTLRTSVNKHPLPSCFPSTCVQDAPLWCEDDPQGEWDEAKSTSAFFFNTKSSHVRKLYMCEVFLKGYCNMQSLCTSSNVWDVYHYSTLKESM